MKKGRHRRFEEARALKHSSSDLDISLLDDHASNASDEPCAECGAERGDHATWCMATEVEDPWSDVGEDSA